MKLTGEVRIAHIDGHMMISVTMPAPCEAQLLASVFCYTNPDKFKAGDLVEIEIKPAASVSS